MKIPNDHNPHATGIRDDEIGAGNWKLGKLERREDMNQERIESALNKVRGILEEAEGYREECRLLAKERDELKERVAKLENDRKCWKDMACNARTSLNHQETRCLDAEAERDSLRADLDAINAILQFPEPKPAHEPERVKGPHDKVRIRFTNGELMSHPDGSPWQTFRFIADTLVAAHPLRGWTIEEIS